VISRLGLILMLGLREECCSCLKQDSLHGMQSRACLHHVLGCAGSVFEVCLCVCVHARVHSP
jgi:hypothetical protein